ncbi:hypothetical protein LCGC14_2443660 [marine sediment metagenome]|uniref:Uncharacterized protein n=1 Tax=marine sediment metagenome TaxID=412755 RepID=A0A0F9BIE5_9ZZZZ
MGRGTKNVSAWVADKLWSRFKSYSTITGQRPAHIVSMALEDYLERKVQAMTQGELRCHLSLTKQLQNQGGETGEITQGAQQTQAVGA